MEREILKLYLGAYAMHGDKRIHVCGINVNSGYIQNIMCQETIPISEIKLLLRPLSSMTEEESRLLQEHLNWIGVNKHQLLRTFTDDLPEYFSIIIKASNWLRSKSFDCDGLIKSGEAIDSTKL